MTAFKSYLSARFKSNIQTIIYILVVVLSITLITALTGQVEKRYDWNTYDYIYVYNSTTYIPVVCMCILAYLLPVMEFSFFKKRINLDCAYSMPISRRAMGAAHFLSGATILAGTYTLSYLANLIVMLTRGPGIYNYVWMIPHYFLCLVLGLALYSFLTMLFNKANTRGDGIWFMILWTFIIILVVGAIQCVTEIYIEYSSCAIPWVTIGQLSIHYTALIDSKSSVEFWENTGCVAWFCVWIAIGIASAVDFFLTFGKQRMEKTEEISDHILGYRTLIPIYAIAGMIVFDDIILWIIIEILAVIGYAIYRRGFRFKPGEIVFLIALLLFLVI